MNEISLCILGRQPALGLAELENLYGAANVRPVGTQAAVLTTGSQYIDFKRLGGSIKCCEILTVLSTTNWREAQQLLINTIPKRMQQSPEGKLQLGLSAYGIPVTAPQLTATALSLKKALRALGRSARVIPNQELTLNSAQVIHNHLTGPTGWELVFVRDGNTIICARTIHEQDIADYTKRDRGRPKRDPRVGMLPPKLAQLLINFATVPETSKADLTLLDPFCGTGVVLQEALLMGYAVLGSDLDPRMVSYTTTNIGWLEAQLPELKAKARLETGDATSFKWPKPIDLVASEVYLGRPFTSMPSPEVLAQTIAECNLIIKKFLRNIGDQLTVGTRLCLALPAWHVQAHVFKHLPLIDQITDLGYNRVSFVHVRSDELLYYRENQIVARELLIITRK
jgi:tRNA G10  N-methylase Trm11